MEKKKWHERGQSIQHVLVNPASWLRRACFQGFRIKPPFPGILMFTTLWGLHSITQETVIW